MESVPSMDDLLDEAEVEIRSPNSAISSITSLSTSRSMNTLEKRMDIGLRNTQEIQTNTLITDSSIPPPDPEPSRVNGHSKTGIEILERTQDMEEECVHQSVQSIQDQDQGITETSNPSPSPQSLSQESPVLTPQPTAIKRSLFSQLVSPPSKNQDQDFEAALAYLGIEEEKDIDQPTCSKDLNQPSEGTFTDLYGDEPEQEEMNDYRESTKEDLIVEENQPHFDKGEIMGWVHEMIDETIYDSIKSLNFFQIEETKETRDEDPKEDQGNSEEMRIIEELVDEIIQEVLKEIIREKEINHRESLEKSKKSIVEEWKTEKPIEVMREKTKKTKIQEPPKKPRRTFGFPEDLKDEGEILVKDEKSESSNSIEKLNLNGNSEIGPRIEDEAVQGGSHSLIEFGENLIVEDENDKNDEEAEVAIEVAEGVAIPEEVTETGPRSRFEEQVIAVVHDMAEETNRMLLTESELQLGKTKPFWIPDSDCVLCMLCSVKFTLLVRRHHCRACGRVLCAACCNERASLSYFGEDEKKNKQRVCQPCLTMLDRIKEYENASALAEVIDGASSSRTRGVLKSRVIEVNAGGGDGEEAGPSGTPIASSILSEGTGVERKRSVVFRDGIRPGDANVADPSEQSAVKALKKKTSRKRVHVTQKLASLKLEEEMHSFLPKDLESSFIIKGADGTIRRSEIQEIESRLREDLPIEVILKRNLSCVIQRSINPTKPNEHIFAVSSRGFFAVGIDEMVYLWTLGEIEATDCQIPISVLQRIAEMFESCLEVETPGARPACSRLPPIHSSTQPAISPCSTHILVYRPSIQETKWISVSWPPHPFVIGISIHDQEFIWALASPNRLLLRLGLMTSWYPCSIINTPGREPVYGTDTNNTVLKVFTDFREWSYRMPNVPGSSVILSGKETIIRIPYLAKQTIKGIVDSNSRMIAWQCGISSEADSHLVCVEEGQVLTTQLLARGHTRQVTGASFVILDSGLKSTEDIFQVTIVEDGIAVRMGGDLLEKLVEALSEGKDWEATSSKGGGMVGIRWKASSCFSQSSQSQLISPIDGLYLGDNYQYGLSLSRALSTAIQISSSPDYTIRLSHVFHMGTTKIPLEDEAKIFSVAEMMARESTKHMDSYVAALIAMGIDLIAIRCLVSEHDVSLDIAEWSGLEPERTQFATSMDQLLPILYGLLEYLPGGVHLELHFSIVSSKDPLPFE